MKVQEVTGGGYRLTIRTGPAEEIQVMLTSGDIDELIGALAAVNGYRVLTDRPDYGTPPTEDEAAVSALLNGFSRYTAAAMGRPEPADVQDEPLPRRTSVSVHPCCGGPNDSAASYHRAGCPRVLAEPATDERGYWWRRLKSPAFGSCTECHKIEHTEWCSQRENTMQAELDRISELYRGGETP